MTKLCIRLIFTTLALVTLGSCEPKKQNNNFEAADGYNFARPSDNVYNIDIYTDNSVIVMYINDTVCYTQRIYGIQKNCWSINNYGGSITVSDVKVTQQ